MNNILYTIFYLLKCTVIEYVQNFTGAVPNLHISSCMYTLNLYTYSTISDILVFLCDFHRERGWDRSTTLKGSVQHKDEIKEAMRRIAYAQTIADKEAAEVWMVAKPWFTGAVKN